MKIKVNFKKLKARINKAESDEWTEKFEQIKAMNIPFGAPIEVTYKGALTTDKELGYYVGVFEDKQSKGRYKLRFTSTKQEYPHGSSLDSEVNKNEGPHIIFLDKIKVLKYEE